MNKSNNFIWYEKYRPQELNDFILPEDIKSKVNEYLKEESLEHIIFHGTWGTGKTSLTNFLIDKLNVDVLTLNASNKDERGIDVINDSIVPFAQRMSFSAFKVVDLRESEKLTSHAQEALKDVIEEYNENCKFIFTTNDIHKLNGAIRSRCVEIHIKPTEENKVDMYKRIWYILNEENIEATKKEAKKLVDVYFPDIRSCVKMAQYYSKSGKLDISKLSTEDDFERILKLLKNSKKKTKSEKIKLWKNIRSIISSMPDVNTEGVYSYIFDNSEKVYNDEELPEVLINLSEYMYRSSQVTDKKTMLSSCILQLINEVN